MNPPSRPVVVAVVGHVEHVTLGRVAAPPGEGEIAHLDAPRTLAGGGGGITFHQLVKSPAEVHLFTALGNDEAARWVEASLAKTNAHVHAARRSEPHTRDVVMIPRSGDRAIVVVGQPLHARRSDDLPWDVLARCDAVYFTGQDPEVLKAARAARILVVTARRREALDASGVRADVIVGSAHDPREASTLADYPVPPISLVMTAGGDGGTIETSEGITRFAAAEAPPVVGTYGAGDSFVGALTYFLACGATVLDACTRAGPYGAAVLADLEPLAPQRTLP
jgi:ribokinase